MSSNHDYKKYAVLYVDDEEQALKYFKKALDKEFRVLTAPSVAEANAILDKDADNIGVVITDQKMPGQTGVELLKRVRTNWPTTVRMLITAYSEIESAIEAVNSGAIYKYITKPADLKQMREILIGAMELFLAQTEREMLLRQRLQVLQRMIVADRVRSLAAMAGGISHHLRNSMTALTCFLEEVKPGESPVPASAPDKPFAEQLWALAQKEREHLVGIVRRVGQGVAEPSSRIADELEVGELIKRATDAATPDLNGRAVQQDVAAGLPKLKMDGGHMAQVVKILLAYAARPSTPAAKLALSARAESFDGAAGVRIRVVGDGPGWSNQDVASFFTPFAFPSNDPSDLGLDLLTAFSIVYQHGGDILILQSPPHGPGFELLLPADPAQIRRPELQDQFLEKLFTRFEQAASQPAQGQAA